LGQGYVFGVLTFAAPLTLLNELSLEISEMRYRPTKGSTAETQEGKENLAPSASPLCRFVRAHEGHFVRSVGTSRSAEVSRHGA